MRFFRDAWSRLTSDQFILNAISHCHIDFETEPYDNTTSMVRRQCNFAHAEQAIIDVEIDKLLKEGIITPSKPVCSVYFTYLYYA